MKTLFKQAVLLGTLAMSATSVMAQSVADTTKEINAQTSITRGHIDNIIQRVNNRQVNSNFRATDYWAQNANFRNSVDQAMKEFEETLEKDIFKKAAYWMDQYNAIHVSNDFSPAQKQILLKERLINLQNQFNTLSKEYQAAILKVYRLIPAYEMSLDTLEFSKTVMKYGKSETLTPEVSLSVLNKRLTSHVTLQTRYSGDDFKEIFVISADGSKSGNFFNRDLMKRHQTGLAGNIIRFELDLKKLIPYFALTDFKKKVFQEAIYPTFKGSCKSTICLGLRASDQVTLLVLVKDLIDRNIQMKLSDGQLLSLKGANVFVGTALDHLSMVDYPVELPFDL